jgi:hypothetical protein
LGSHQAGGVGEKLSKVVPGVFGTVPLVLISNGASIYPVGEVSNGATAYLGGVKNGTTVYPVNEVTMVQWFILVGLELAPPFTLLAKSITEQPSTLAE